MTEPINLHEGRVDSGWLSKISAGRTVLTLPWHALTQRECDAIELVYWLGLTTRQTARLLGCTHTTVARDIRSAIKKLSGE